MLSLLFTALVAPVTQFPGGDLSELARAIVSDAGGPAVICAFAPAQLPAFSFNATDPTDLGLSVHKAAKLKMVGGSRPIFHSGTLPLHLFQFAGLGGSKPTGFTWTPIPIEALREGSVTFDTPKRSAVLASSLAGNGWAKQVAVHWVYQDLPLIVSTKNQLEAEFFAYVAKALGSKVIATRTSLTLDLDPAEFRSRAKKTVQEFASAEKMKMLGDDQKADIYLLQAVLSAASDADLTRAFARQGAQARFMASPAQSDLIRSRILLVANRDSGPQQLEIRSEQRGQQAQEIRAYGRRTSGLSPEMLNRIDTRLPAYFILHSDFRCEVEVSLMGPNGRPGGTVRF